MEEPKSKILEVILSESDTIWLFDIPDVNVSSISQSMEYVVARNEKYKEVGEKWLSFI